jgi:hypothetical protein
MKTKVFFFLFLLIGLATIRLSAQNARDVYNWPVPAGVVQLDVNCDGQIVDQLVNTLDYTLKCRDKYKDGNLEGWNQHLNNVNFVSLWTGETFTLQGHETGQFDMAMGYGQFSSILIGSKGSHYIMTVFYELDPNTWILIETEIKSKCH